MSLDLVITRTKQGILLIFFFQRKKDIRRQWIQVKRADLQPTEHSIICGAHFAHECFEDDAMVKMGLKDKKKQFEKRFGPHNSAPAARSIVRSAQISGLWRARKKKYRRLRVTLLAKGHEQVELCTSYQFLR